MKSSDLIVREEGDLLSTKVDGELISMSVDKGACYGFNTIGTRLWELLEKPRCVDELCEHMCAEFAVGEAECRAEVSEFVEELRKEGLVGIRSVK